MKIIRKFLNLPNRDQSKILSDGREQMISIASEIRREKNDNERKREVEKNSNCPNCKGKKIVNKISRVEGSGYVSGSFIYGSGSIYGSSKTDTNEVNHCNDCGNQWKKYDWSYTSDADVIADCSWSLCRLFR